MKRICGEGYICKLSKLPPGLFMDETVMDSALYFEDIEIGQIWTSPRRTVTESDVVNFASTTGDFNPLHVDYDFAGKSVYRQPIAHGLLGISWVAGLGSYFPYVATVAFSAVRDWEFTRPLYFGDTVFVETTAIEKSASGRRRGKVNWHRKLINQRNEIVQQGVFETLVETRIVAKSRPHINSSETVANQNPAHGL